MRNLLIILFSLFSLNIYAGTTAKLINRDLNIQGTGQVVDNRFITAAHLCRASKVLYLGQEKLTILKVSKRTDLCEIQLPKSYLLKSFKLAKEPIAYNRTVVIGRGFGLGKIGEYGPGIVIKYTDEEKLDLLRKDFKDIGLSVPSYHPDAFVSLHPVESGASGGAVLDCNNQVVGIITAKFGVYSLFITRKDILKFLTNKE